MVTSGALREIDNGAFVQPEWGDARRAIRVLLIQPPNRQGVRSLLPHQREGDEAIGQKPPLGLLYVATTVAKFSKHQVKVLDCKAQGLDVEAAVVETEAYQPELVGISAWTEWWYPAYRMGERIKQQLPDVHLVYGGPHLGIYPEETLSIPFVDSVIVGDGELPFLYLANMVANRIVDNRLPGLHFKQHGVKGPPGTFYVQKELDAVPIPDRTLLPLDLYSSVLQKNDLITTMITSRGCPFRCTFCKLNFQKTLCHSAERVVEEFRIIHEMGIREVEVYDDTFTWSKKRLVRICEGLIHSGINLTWSVRDRVTNARPELLELMYRAGCRRVHYGVESGVDRVLQRMRKGTATGQAIEAISHAKKAGMTVLAYFMFGNLDETEDDMRKTIDFALQLDADYCEFSITIPYPGTEMYEEALSSGLITHDYWREYANKPTPHFRPTQLIENHADLNTLIEMRNNAIRRFYFRPRYVLRQLRSASSAGELRRKARMGATLLAEIVRTGPKRK